MAEVRSTAKVLEVEGELVAGLVANCPTHSRRGSVEDPALASRLARNPPRICDTCDSVTHIVGASLGVSSKARGKETSLSAAEVTLRNHKIGHTHEERLVSTAGFG